MNMGMPPIKKGIAPCRHKRKQYKNYKNQARITIKYKKYRETLAKIRNKIISLINMIRKQHIITSRLKEWEIRTSCEEL